VDLNWRVFKFFYVKIMSSFLNLHTKMISVKRGFPQIKVQSIRERTRWRFIFKCWFTTQIENEIKTMSKCHSSQPMVDTSDGSLSEMGSG
jgi:hypothetical protein